MKGSQLENSELKNASFREGESSSMLRLRNFMQDVSVIGARYLVESSTHYLSKVIWTLLLLLSLALAFYQIQERIVYYRGFPVQTNVELIPEKELQFPQVTICNENMMRKSVAQQYGLADVLPQMFPPWSDDRLKLPTPNLTILRDLKRTPEEWNQIRINLSQPREQAVESFHWIGRKRDPRELESVATNIGQCFAFNTGRVNLSANRAGSGFGLQMHLKVDQFDYLVSNSPAAGFRILLHNQNEAPLMKESGFRISPGFMTTVAATRETISRSPAPYSDCIDSPGYQMSDCNANCESAYVISKCKCKAYYMKDDAAADCDLIDYYKCVVPSLAAYPSDGDGQRRCTCAPQCQSVHYSYVISQGVASQFFVNYMYETVANKQISKETITREYANVEIFYSTMEHRRMTMEAAYTFMALLSDIGGALGLLLGATLLTVYEILEFGIRMLNFEFDRRAKSKPSPKQIFIHAG